MTDKQNKSRFVMITRRAARLVVLVICASGLAPVSAHAQQDDEPAQQPARRAAAPIESAIPGANLVGVDVTTEVVGGQVIIKGNAEHLRALEAIIELLGETMEERVLEVVTVNERDAADIAQSLEQAIIDMTPGRESILQPSLRALSSNILLVSALPEDIDWVLDIIEQVDAIPSELGKIEQLVFQVQYRRASEVAGELEPIIRQMEQVRGLSQNESRLQIIAVNANNTIMVTAQESDKETIEQLIARLDVEPDSEWSEATFVLYPLLHSKANDMAGVINDLLEAPDATAEAEAIIRKLNISKAAADGTIIELPPINLEKNIKIIPHAGTNSLIVATAEENVGPMGELIRLMDDVPMAEQVGIKAFKLEYAKADTVRELLDSMFDKGKNLSEDPDGSGGDGVPEGLYGALVYNISIIAETRTNTIIVSGREEQMLLVAQVISDIDRPAVANKEVRVVTVTEHDAGEIATAVEEALTDANPNREDDEQAALRAMGGNILVVTAAPEEMNGVVALIKRIDSVPSVLGQLENQLLVFPVANRRAADVATQLDEILTKLQETAGVPESESKLQIIPINANNSVLVMAARSDRTKIQTLIEQIDVEPTKDSGWVTLTVFPLIHADAGELVTVLTDLIMRDDNAEAAEEVIYRLSISNPDGTITPLSPIDREKPLELIADDATNSLIVATVQENVGPVGELVRLLDGVPMAEAVAVRLFPLRFADAESVRDVLNTMFDEGRSLTEDPDGSGSGHVPEGEYSGLVFNIGLAADTRTNTLIVSGREEQLTIAEMVVGELDRPATALKFPLRLMPLAHADATRIGSIIEDLFQQRFDAASATGANQSALERERVFLSVDIRTNALILSASDENYAEIVTIARQLDTKPATVFDQIRIIACERLSADDVKDKVDELWQRKGELLSQADLPQDLPIVVADERSNALIVASTMEDFEEIARLVEVLESQPLIDDTRLFTLEYADAQVLSSMLDELFSGMAGTMEAFDAPTIIPDSRSNALVVAASRDTMERVVTLVDRLDVEAGPLTAIFRVYPLAHASSRQLAERMQELFDSRAAGQSDERTPIVILPEESSNSLVCSASRDDHLVILDLLGLLDSPSSLAKQFQIFPLEMAKADQVAEKLDQLFQAGGSGDARTDAIAIEPDVRTNSIIAWASPSQMNNIADVISRLDTAKPAVERMVKVIQLRRALAEDFATLLEETLLGEGGDEDQAVIVSFNEQTPDGYITRKLLRQDIRITPDPRSNSLMVYAPADSMDMLEAMIRDFDTIRPITSEVRLFPLINSDAESMVDQLTSLFDTEGGGDGDVDSQLIFGGLDLNETDLASAGQRLAFSADPRTNTLLASGAEIDLNMVEDLVRYLDAQEVDERVTEVYAVKYTSAEEIASAVQGFIDQEQDVLSDVDDEMSQMRRAEQQVSIESLGNEEEGSSRLIVGSSRRAYQRTMDMIHMLDQPEPQVRISVLIAEVKLTDSVELGVELAGQDLHFSENAVLGPNGVIQGTQFDYVLGTALGAAGVGLGGLNFTVGGEDFSFLLHALQQDSRLQVLSRPTLTIRNGEEGKIDIGDEIPVITSSQTSDSGSVSSQVGSETVGIKMTATPHISPDGFVTLEIVQEVSNFSGQDLQLTEGIRSPVISTREIDTNVTVRDGDTVVIGGLITESESSGVSKIPLLGDLPGIGWMFRTESVSRQRTELLVVLTVEVLNTPGDMQQMSITERDRFTDPVLRQHPLMEGLRIKPQEGGLGPVDGDQHTPVQQQSREPVEKKRFGPKPKTYGPVISRPPATTTTARQPVFGPKIARGNGPDVR